MKEGALQNYTYLISIYEEDAANPMLNELISGFGIVGGNDKVLVQINFDFARLFRNEEGHSSRVWHRARMVAKEVHTAMQRKVASSRMVRWVAWRAPDPHAFILNTDGAIKNSSKCASAGGLLRDSQGEWIRGFCSQGLRTISQRSYGV